MLLLVYRYFDFEDFVKSGKNIYMFKKGIGSFIFFVGEIFIVY